MKLFIKYLNGEILDHPVIEDNMKQLFANFDPENPSEPYVKFERIAPIYPISPYTTLISKYEMGDDGIVRDVHDFYEMTYAEKNELIELAKANKPYESWVFNSEICHFDPPVPYPMDNKYYIWDEETISWKEHNLLDTP